MSKYVILILIVGCLIATLRLEQIYVSEKFGQSNR